MYGIFSRADHSFCSVPMPPIDAFKGAVFDFTPTLISKYCQSQTHPSIVYAEDGWNGHKYWMVTSPYPYATGQFEQMCIYYGDEQPDGTPAVVFTPISGIASGEYTMISNPITKTTENLYVNSDPDMILDGDTMWLVSRWNAGTTNAYAQKSLTGQAWTPRTSIPMWEHTPELLSPAMVKTPTGFRSYCLSSLSQPFSGIHILESSTFDGAYSYIKKGCLRGKRSVHPWHGDVFIDHQTNKYYMIVCAVYDGNISGDMALFLAESEDGVNFYLFAKPLSTAVGAYRPTAFIRPSDRKLVVYFGTEGQMSVNPDLLPNGASDVAPDGRYIALLHQNFDEVLRKLRGKVGKNY